MTLTRRGALGAITAVLGIALTAALTWSVSRVVGQHIGLSSEPASVIRGLAPEPALHPAPGRDARPGPSRHVSHPARAAPVPAPTPMSPTLQPPSPSLLAPAPAADRSTAGGSRGGGESGDGGSGRSSGGGGGATARSGGQSSGPDD